MNNFFRFFSIISLALVLITSCSNKFQKEIDEVTQMQVKVKGVEDSFNSLDPKKIDEAFAEYNIIMGQIKTYYNPDSITHEQSQLMDNYKGIKKGAKSFSSDYANLKNNITLLNTQLEKLKTDFENESVTPENTETFLNHERNNVELVQQNLSTLIFNYDFVLTAHDSLAPKVKSLIFNNDF
jgi:predicted  nucleic acid-binding Zn-ribbon protein